MEEFKHEDYHLYKILKPQDLNSLMAGQLLYDDRDIGFIGVDNPVLQKFDELKNIFSVINYFISIQIHRKHMMKHLRKGSRSVYVSRHPQKYSLYNRISSLKIEEPLVVIYCDMSNINQPQTSDVGNKAPDYAEAYVGGVLGSIFSGKNVFSIGDEEFLIVCDKHLDDVEEYMELAQDTVEQMNLHIFMGMVYVERYEENFFHLVNNANAEMLNQRRDYRDCFLGKYQVKVEGTTFHDLVEIRPERDYYHVLYSEYADVQRYEGNTSEMLQRMVRVIHPDDRKKFLNFWNEKRMTSREQLLIQTKDSSESFMMKIANNTFVRREVTVLAYTDIDDELVLICFTK